MDFVPALKLILVEEFHHTQEDAERLVKAYRDVVMQGIMQGMALRATAMALEMRDADAGKRKTQTPDASHWLAPSGHIHKLSTPR